MCHEARVHPGRWGSPWAPFRQRARGRLHIKITSQAVIGGRRHGISIARPGPLQPVQYQGLPK